MANAVACPHCHRKLHVPLGCAGRRGKCPCCQHALRVPAGGATDTPTPSVRLGVAALVLGLVSVPVLCVPLAGYASFVLSGAGLVLGMWGLARSREEKAAGIRYRLAAGGPVPRLLGGRYPDFPLAGMVACLLGLTLALLPWLFR
jgi:uncharacterized paraquat-inducible protein A